MEQGVAMPRWIRWAAIGVLAIAAAAWIASNFSLRSPDSLQETLVGYGAWAVLVSTFLMIAQAIIAPVPGNVITIANGLVFGPFYGALLSWSTTMLGATICFFLSKSVGKPFALRFVGPSLGTIERFFQRYGLQAVFLIRIMPFVPFDAVSYTAGLVGVPYSRFLLATAVGTIPSTLVYSYLGSSVILSHWWMLPAGLCMTVLMAGVLPRLLRKTIMAVPAIEETGAE